MHDKSTTSLRQGMLDPAIKAVYFDAVGTLIHPQPSAVEVYAEVGRHFGSRVDPDEIARRFRHFFKIEENIDFDAGLATSEAREKLRWQRIVAGVLDDVADEQACFAALFEHFSRPDSWCCDPEAEDVLAELSRRGYGLGLASNYDGRLRAVAEGLPPLRFIEHLVISAEVGWRKPGRGFFAAVCRTANMPAQAILFVGDDPANDYEGAVQHGLAAALLDPAGKHCSLTERRLANLKELVDS